MPLLGLQKLSPLAKRQPLSGLRVADNLGDIRLEPPVMSTTTPMTTSKPNAESGLINFAKRETKWQKGVNEFLTPKSDEEAMAQGLIKMPQIFNKDPNAKPVYADYTAGVGALDDVAKIAVRKAAKAVIKGKSIDEIKDVFKGIFDDNAVIEEIISHAQTLREEIGASKNKIARGIEDFLSKKVESLKKVKPTADLLSQAKGNSLIQEAKKYKSAEEFVKAQPAYYHGTPEKTFKLDSNKPLFLTDDFDSANTYAGYRYDTEPTGKVAEFRLKEGKTLNLNDRQTIKKTMIELFGNPEKRRLFNEIPDEFLLKGEYTRRPKESVDAFDDWVWEKFPGMEQKATRQKYIDAYFAYGEPSKEMVYQKWNEIIKHAKDNGYDFIDHMTEDPSASITFPEKVVLNPKKSLLTKSQLTSIWEEANKGVKKGVNEAFGGLAGVEYDEETGKIGYDPIAGAAGIAGMGIFGRIKREPVINIKRLNIPDTAKQTVIDIAEKIKPELEKIKGGILKNEEVLEAAKVSEILTKGTTKEATLKSEAILLKTRQQLAAMAKNERVTPEFVETLKIVKAEATRRGRELQSLGIDADPVLGNVKSQIVKKLLDIGKNTDEIVEAAKNVDFDNAEQVTAFYRKFVKPTLPELIDEYRYINLLSSPRTHIVNSFSNLMQVAGLRPAMRLASGAVDNVATKLTGKAQEYYIKQVPAYYKGVYNSIGDATKGFIDAMKGKSAVYRPDLSRIPTNSKLLRPFQYIPRVLEGSDIFFRTLATGGEMEALLKGGMTDAAAVKKASETASELVFRRALDPANKTGQGAMLSGVDKLTSAVYKLRSVPGVKWFIPFVQTPMNILKQGIEYSPLGLATLPGNADKIAQIGKAMVGSTVFAGAGWLAFNDKTTWAIPVSPKEKEAFYAAGMQAYSIKIGDKWYSYSKLGPLAYPIAMAAATKFYLQDNPQSVTDTNIEKASKVMAGISEFFADQSYLEGMGDFLDMFRGDVTAASRIVTNMPSQLIPLSSLQRWTATFIDPVYRKADNGLSIDAITQNLMKGIPFLSKRVPSYVTPTGEPSKRQLPLLNQFSPVNVTKENPEGKGLFDLMRSTSKETKLLNKEKEENKVSIEAEYNRLKTLPKDQAKIEFDALIKSDPEMAKKIVEMGTKEQRNLDPKDELLLSLGVENGLRARTIKSELDKLKTREEKKAYYQALMDKKVITKQVNEQLLKLLEE